MAGQAKGRLLRTLPRSPHLRPILARVKKSLFDILRPRLAGCRFLDLYAGTGAVGLEALSRGAEFVAFVENDSRAIALLKENSETLGFAAKAAVVRADSTADLSFLQKRFDLIFLGPPYKDAEKKPLVLVEPTLQNVLRSKLPADSAWIVAQHHKKETPAPTVAELARFRQERYGDTVLSFYEAP